MRRYGIIDKLAEMADLYNEPVIGKPLVEICEGRYLLIENHFGIIGYGCGRISVKITDGEIVIEGMNLCIRNMTKQRLAICGDIAKVEWIRR